MAYGPSLTAIDAQLANYVSRILGGAKPGDLPIEQPSRFEFVVNLKTARAIGIRIPSAILLRADEVID
jgi:putative ABC transport system substrate-binding protein